MFTPRRTPGRKVSVKEEGVKKEEEDYFSDQFGKPSRHRYENSQQNPFFLPTPSRSPKLPDWENKNHVGNNSRRIVDLPPTPTSAPRQRKANAEVYSASPVASRASTNLCPTFTPSLHGKILSSNDSIRPKVQSKSFRPKVPSLSNAKFDDSNPGTSASASIPRPPGSIPRPSPIKDEEDDETFFSPSSISVPTWVDDILPQDALAARSASGVTEAERTIAGIKVKLFPHQVLGSRFMVARERQGWNGGLNADVMGLGKTLSMLSLVVTRLSETKQLYKTGQCEAPTLVICPRGVVSVWVKEIRKYTGLSVLEYTQTKRHPTDLKFFATFDIVVTTPGIVLVDSEAHGSSNVLRNSPIKNAIFSVTWVRVIIDEAHLLRNPAAKQTKACLRLKSRHRWMVTGTPVQNKADDLQPLFQFVNEKGEKLCDPAVFKQRISKPTASKKSSELEFREAIVLLQRALEPMTIRRLKKDVADSCKLPPRTFEIVPFALNKRENAFYHALKDKMAAVIEALSKLSKQRGLEFYTCVLVMFLRLRQTCNHVSLVVEGSNVELAKDFSTDNVGLDSALVGDYEESTECCTFCRASLTPANQGKLCETCRSKAILGQLSEFKGKTSTKISEVMAILDIIDKRSGCTDKTVIVSDSTAMLDLVKPFLKAKGKGFVDYRGTMTPAKRELALKAIESDPDTSILLLSLKAGGVGLNLVACNTLILIEPWWNPSVEDQVFERVHRIGQQKPVFIYKLVAKYTIEERILEVQAKKTELANTILGKSGQPIHKLGTLELLKMLDLPSALVRNAR
ncbi:SNF2 family N-terminal domain-containing protein [Mycena floridula]|nr:SNF2 family N-terminal domain-containing protein [Mycena floridula]